MQTSPESVQAHPVLPSEIEQVLQAVMAMNQQTLQLAGEHLSQVTVTLVREMVEEIIERVVHTGRAQREQCLHTEDIRQVETGEKPVKASANEGYGDAIEALLKEHPDLGVAEMAHTVGCSERTVYKWMARLRPMNSERLDSPP